MIQCIVLALALLQGVKPELVSLLGKPFYAQPDKQGAIQKADAALAADPKNLDLLLAAARARDTVLEFRAAIELYGQAIILAPGDPRPYRFRGHRYISIRRFDEAVRDLEKAATLAPSSFDVLYHLGLAHYLRGDFAKAAVEYGRCLEWKEAPGALPAGWRSCTSVGGNDDSRVALADWRYRALRRAGRHDEARGLLETIHEKLAVQENPSYYQALLLYKRLRREPELLDPARLTGNQLPTVGYAVANFHLVEGRREEACTLLRRVVEDPNWNAFGFIAAEVELARKTCP